MCHRWSPLTPYSLSMSRRPNRSPVVSDEIAALVAEGDDADGEKNEDNNPRVGDEEGQEVEPIPAATDAPAATASTPAAQTE